MDNKYVLIFFLASILTPDNVFSQRTFVSIGADLGLPASYEQSYKNRGTGFGGSFRVESFWGRHMSGMATVGFLSFAKASPFSSTPTYTNQVNVIPIQLGLKYYIKPQNGIPKGFFISAELGVMPTTTHITFTNDTKNKSKLLDFIGAPGIGYQAANLEFGFRLQYDFSETGYHVYYYNFRIAYVFLKKKKLNDGSKSGVNEKHP